MLYIDYTVDVFKNKTVELIHPTLQWFLTILYKGVLLTVWQVAIVFRLYINDATANRKYEGLAVVVILAGNWISIKRTFEMALF